MLIYARLDFLGPLHSEVFFLALGVDAQLVQLLQLTRLHLESLFIWNLEKFAVIVAVYLLADSQGNQGLGK